MSFHCDIALRAKLQEFSMNPLTTIEYLLEPTYTLQEDRSVAFTGQSWNMRKGLGFFGLNSSDYWAQAKLMHSQSATKVHAS